MTAPITKYRLQEGYLLSDKTISIDLDKFESGESNKIILVGVSGAGKTTLGNYLAKKYNCIYNELDKCCKKVLTHEEYRNYILDLSSAADKDIFKKFWIKCFKPSLLTNKKQIIEGALFQSYIMFPSTRPLVNKFPVIILGKSSLRAVYDRTQRTLRKHKSQDKYNSPKDILIKYKKGLELNFKYLQKYVNLFKKERIKAGGEVKEFKVPNLK